MAHEILRNPGQVAHAIPLFGKYGEGKRALVDPSDSDLLRRWRWTVTKKGYPVRHFTPAPGKMARRKMHVQVMRPPRHLVVDHVNGDPLDNRRCNLRLVTEGQNRRNHGAHDGSTSRFVGVSRDRKSGQWRADVKHEGRQICLGRFADEVDAARARDAFVSQHYGGLGRLNFDPGPAPPEVVVEVEVPTDFQRTRRSGGGGKRKVAVELHPEIRARYAAGGVTQRELGLAYGVDQSVISRIVNRSTRTHV